MARRSVAAQQKTEPREPASLPEVLVSPSQAAPNEKDAYWLELIQEPQKLKAAIATEDFWPMLRKFPDSLWTDGRLSLYLYRRPDDEGLMIKNPEGAKKYIKVLHQPVDEEYVSKNYGGGKYTLYLKLDSDTTLRECTFPIDGVPKVMTGQVVEIAGKPVSVSTPAPTPPIAASDDGNTIAKVIDANSRANESGMTILAHASKAAIDMVKEQAATASTPPTNPVTDKLLEVLLTRALAPAPPVADSMTTALTLMEKLETIIEKRNPAPIQPERETPLDDAIGMVEKVTGKPLQDILKGTKAVPESEYNWVAPLANFGMQALGRLPEILRELRESRQIEFERAVYLRSLQPGQVPALPAAQPRQPGPQAVPNPPVTAPSNAADPGQLINAMVGMICQGFDRHRDTGDDVAAAVAFQFGEAIESFGLERTLGNRQEMKTFIAGIPAFVQRSQDARWSPFEDDFLSYMENRWPPDPGSESEPERQATQMPSVPRTTLTDAS